MIDCTENKDENFLIDTEYNGQYEVIINNKKTIVLQQAEKGEGIFNADEFFFNKMNNFQSSDGENIEIKFEKDSMDISIEYARIIKAMPENECINYDFFSDLFYKDSIYTAKIPADEMDAVYFENCNKYAALMPIRMSSED